MLPAIRCVALVELAASTLASLPSSVPAPRRVPSRPPQPPRQRPPRTRVASSPRDLAILFVLPLLRAAVDDRVSGTHAQAQHIVIAMWSARLVLALREGRKASHCQVVLREYRRRLGPMRGLTPSRNGATSSARARARPFSSARARQNPGRSGTWENARIPEGWTRL